MLVVEKIAKIRRPHSSLGYRPPAPEVFLPAFASAQPRSLVQRPTIH